MKQLQYLQQTFTSLAEDIKYLNPNDDKKVYFLLDSNVINLMLKPWDETGVITIADKKDKKQVIAYSTAKLLADYIVTKNGFVSMLPQHAREITDYLISDYLSQENEIKKADDDNIINEINSGTNILDRIIKLKEKLPNLYESLVYPQRKLFKYKQLNAFNKIVHIKEVAPNRDYNQDYETIYNKLLEMKENNNSSHKEESLNVDAKALALLEYINQNNKECRYTLITTDSLILEYLKDAKKADTIAPFIHLALHTDKIIEKNINKIANELNNIEDKTPIPELDLKERLVKKFVDIIDYISIDEVDEFNTVHLSKLLELLNSVDMKKELKNKIQDTQNEFIAVTGLTLEAIKWQTTIDKNKNTKDFAIRLPVPIECSIDESRELLDKIIEKLYKREQIDKDLANTIFEKSQHKIIHVATAVVAGANSDYKTAIEITNNLYENLDTDENGKLKHDGELVLMLSFFQRQTSDKDSSFQALYDTVYKLGAKYKYNHKRELELLALTVLSLWNEKMTCSDKAEYIICDDIEEKLMKAVGVDYKQLSHGDEIKKRVLLNALSFLMLKMLLTDRDFKIKEDALYIALQTEENSKILKDCVNDCSYYRHLMSLFWEWLKATYDKNTTKKLQDKIAEIQKSKQNDKDFKGTYKEKRLEMLSEYIEKITTPPL